MKMRFSLVVAVVLVGISVSGWAQQQSNTFKVKPTQEKQAKPSAPIGKTAPSTSPAAANAKSLQNAEHQGTRVPAHSGAKKTVPALKPVKDKPNPPINFNGGGAGKTPGVNTASNNPYKGRLKQKGNGHGSQ
jgi:cytoskeletal protein RodZ